MWLCNCSLKASLLNGVYADTMIIFYLKHVWYYMVKYIFFKKQNVLFPLVKEQKQMSNIHHHAKGVMQLVVEAPDLHSNFNR